MPFLPCFRDSKSVPFVSKGKRMSLKVKNNHELQEIHEFRCSVIVLIIKLLKNWCNQFFRVSVICANS